MDEETKVVEEEGITFEEPVPTDENPVVEVPEEELTVI
jgi:hypothetical protein